MFKKTSIDGMRKQVSTKMNEAIAARDALQEKVDKKKNMGENVRALEKMIKTYNRDIKGYMNTLGIK